MTDKRWLTMAVGALLVAGCALAQDAKPKPDLPTAAPAGATVLVADKAESIGDNWFTRGTKNPAAWILADGAWTPNKMDITSRKEFGDIRVHVEFACPVDAAGKPLGHGNAGVAFEGRYEVQILNSFGNPKLGPTDCAAFYNQRAAAKNVCKPAGEWQTYDIWFKAPRFDDGKVTAQARATVYQNGELVQDDAEFNGPTGIQYGDFKGEVPTGPIVLQGNHDLVHFRNVWVVAP